MLQFFAQVNKSSNTTKEGEKKLKVVCVDDQNIIRDRTIEYIKEISNQADVFGFENVDEAMSFVQNSGCDILLPRLSFMANRRGLSLLEICKKSIQGLT